MGHGETILAVHHRGRALCSVTVALGCGGYRILTARVPEQVPEILAEHPVDVVVAGVDTHRLQAALKQARPEMPVVVLVAEGMPAPAGPQDAVVFEPVDPAHLREVVEALLAGNEAPVRGPGGSAPLQALEMRAS